MQTKIQILRAKIEGLKKKNRIKNLVRTIHLWLGLISGLLVFFLGITGCILAFQHEIENASQEYRFTPVQNKVLLPPSKLKVIADQAVPFKMLGHSIGYEPGKTSQVIYYNVNPEYYWTVFINPYSGEVLKVKNMDEDFFRIVLMGHYYLWLPPNIGQPILASATLIFVILLITGLILWWPKDKAARKKRFSIKWNARWRRFNYDLHSVFGFYVSWIVIFIALSGLVMGFQWFASSVYFVSSGGDKLQFYYETHSAEENIQSGGNPNAMDVLWQRARKAHPAFKGSIEVHVPVSEKSAIEVAVNPDPDTYWQADYRYYDQYTYEEIDVNHMYGKFEGTSVADKIMRMNYDIHVGAIGGLATKFIAFFASLIAASLPVTGLLIWLGRRKKI